jgi:hypothetical protein
LQFSGYWPDHEQQCAIVQQSELGRRAGLTAKQAEQPVPLWNAAGDDDALTVGLTVTDIQKIQQS